MLDDKICGYFFDSIIQKINKIIIHKDIWIKK